MFPFLESLHFLAFYCQAGMSILQTSSKWAVINSIVVWPPKFSYHHILFYIWWWWWWRFRILCFLFTLNCWDSTSEHSQRQGRVSRMLHFCIKSSLRCFLVNHYRLSLGALSLWKANTWSALIYPVQYQREKPVDSVTPSTKPRPCKDEDTLRNPDGGCKHRAVSASGLVCPILDDWQKIDGDNISRVLMLRMAQGLACSVVLGLSLSNVFTPVLPI